MKLADYILDFIAAQGVKDIFGLIGGTIGVLTDRLGEYQKQGKLRFVHVNDERSAAMATEAYARENGFGVCLVSGGPGADNLVTGIDGAFKDSIPCLFIGGQVDKQVFYAGFHKNRFKDRRQGGTQETQHVLLFDSITKYSALVQEPEDIRYHLEKAVWLAKRGRPGPVFLSIFKDMQKAEIDPEKLRGFDPLGEPDEEIGLCKGRELEEKTRELIGLINKAKRPVILFGGGVRCSGTTLQAKMFAEKIGAPVVLSWGGFDAFPHDDPSFIGTIGDYATRAGNFTVQNCDLLIGIGTWLAPRQTTMDYKNFARGAKIALVDISRSELIKEYSESGGRHIDLPIHCNLRDFFPIFDALSGGLHQSDISEWYDWVQAEYKIKYDAVIPEDYRQEELVNPRLFLRQLSELLPADSRIAGDVGLNNILMMSCFRVKEGQRAFTNCGTGSIGYGLPAAFGLSYAIGKKPTVCIMGDGGLQQTLGLLENIKHQNVPLKIFVLNNREYGIMTNTQRKSYQGRYFGSTTEPDGYSAPHFVKVAEAFGIKAVRLERMSDVRDVIERTIAFDGPMLVEVMIPGEFPFLCVDYGDPLEDSRMDRMTPSGIVREYLSLAEMRRAMRYVPLLPKTLARG